jgi:hypothetical protein
MRCELEFVERTKGGRLLHDVFRRLTYRKNKNRFRTDGKGIFLVLGDLRQNLLQFR